MKNWMIQAPVLMINNSGYDLSTGSKYLFVVLDQSTWPKYFCLTPEVGLAELLPALGHAGCLEEDWQSINGSKGDSTKLIKEKILDVTNKMIVQWASVCWLLTWSTLSMPEWRATSLELLWVTWGFTYILPFIPTLKSNTRHVWSIPKAKSFMSRSLLRASWACLEVSRVLSTFSSKTWFSPFIKWDYLCTFKVMIHDHLFNTVLSRSKRRCWLWVSLPPSSAACTSWCCRSPSPSSCPRGPSPTLCMCNIKHEKN